MKHIELSREEKFLVGPQSDEEPKRKAYVSSITKRDKIAPLLPYLPFIPVLTVMRATSLSF